LEQSAELQSVPLAQVVQFCDKTLVRCDDPPNVLNDNDAGLSWLMLLALEDLIAQAYPKLKSLPRGRGRSEDEYQRKLKSLKNRISSGRNWYLIQQKFSPGILALVHTGGDNKIHNSE
jgi:hypothetical protein